MCIRDRPCTGSFGDAKGLDLWTYYPSHEVSSTLVIVAPGSYADVAVTKSVSVADPVIGDDDVYTCLLYTSDAKALMPSCFSAACCRSACGAVRSSATSTASSHISDTRSGMMPSCDDGVSLRPC